MDIQETYKLVVENIPAVTWITDRDGNTVFVAPGVADVIGYSADEVMAENSNVWFGNLHPDDRDQVIDRFERMFVGEPFDVTYRFTRKDGRTIWLHDRGISTYVDDGRELAIGVFLDVTETVKTQRRLERAESRFNHLAQTSTDWIWQFDENCIFTYASPRVEQLLGYTVDEVIGKSAFDFIPSPERERVAQEFEVIKERREPFSNLLNVNQRKDGSKVTLESSGTPIFDTNGRFIGYLGIDRDITSRKDLEERLRHVQKMEALGTMAGGIAHNFNNILGAIVGFTDLALAATDDETPIKAFLTEIKNAGDRATQLVRQILMFSRKSETERQPVDLVSIVGESLALLRAFAPANVTVDLHAPEEVPLVVGDASQLHQVVMNLGTNAVQALGKETGNVVISVEELDVTMDQAKRLPGASPGRHVKIAVSDGGGGIDPLIADRVFEPYFTTKPAGKGTGMGLSVVMGVVKSHDGAVNLINDHGKGCTFEIYLPVAADEQAIPANIATGTSGGKESILLVDDDAAVLHVTKMGLEMLGYAVTAVPDGESALGRFLDDPDAFDVIVTDRTMPGISGHELRRELMATRPEIPVVVCSGYDDSANSEEGRAAGRVIYLTKPVRLKQLTSAIRRLLETTPE